jgi:uncharacterized membrane protein (UPF0127 family)
MPASVDTAMTKNFTPPFGRPAIAIFISLSMALMTGCAGSHSESGHGGRAAVDMSRFPTGRLGIVSAGNREKVHEFDVWIADTGERRTRGLMFVEHLPKDRGMLFLFGDPQPVYMWMKNTLIPLDMLFVAKDGRIARIAANTVPESLDTIDSGADVTAVLELAGGECARRGIQVGDYLRHAAFTAPAPARQARNHLIPLA